MKIVWIVTIIMAATLPAGAAQYPLNRTFEGYASHEPNNRIDELVFARLKQEGIQPANVCSNSAFVRRVFLDVLGTLPTADEARNYLMDESQDKRRELIDRLLEQDAFADYWAMKWCDLLRVKSEFPINLWPNAAQAYHHWIRTSLARNKPYDQFAREILTASGSNFRVPPVNFYRAITASDPETIARAVALDFMGCRTDHWAKDRRVGLAAFFSRLAFKNTDEWKEEIVFFDALGTQAAADREDLGTPVFPDGTTANIPRMQDPRVAFADWLIRPENPWFARTIVNRVWYWLMGRGIIHEPDDIRPDNPPSHPELLAWLEKELVDSHYDLKHIYRLILNSKVYQLSSVPRSTHPDAQKLFANYSIRRLEAEVLIDAICDVTGTTEEYFSQIPEPFTFIPADQRSIALSDGSITSAYLEMYGRSPRDTGLISERNDHSTAAQRLHLLNSSHVRRKIEQGPKLRNIMMVAKRDPQQAVTRLYLTILSRFPTKDEAKAMQEYANSAEAKGTQILADLAWALMNSSEFQYRH